MADYSRLFLSTIDKPGYWFAAFWLGFFVVVLVVRKIISSEVEFIDSAAVSLVLLSLLYVAAVFFEYSGVQSSGNRLVDFFAGAFYHPSVFLGLCLIVPALKKSAHKRPIVVALCIAASLVMSVFFYLPKMS